LLELALDAPRQPWVIFASSREVYGQPATLPATETAPLTPVNVYGRAKAAGEALCDDASRAGLRVAIVRLSNVYGSPQDHRDRVVPGFVRAALAGDPLRVDGAENTFDFTHLDDVVDGLIALVDVLPHRGSVPPLHLLTGVPTTLSELASLAVRLSGSRSSIVEAPSRTFDVARFFGDPSRAHAILGWHAHVSVQVGVARLINQMRTDRAHGLSAATTP
jgi:nucleoside-diphosphate-sugar epimerase